MTKNADEEFVNAAARAMLEGRGELGEFLMREVGLRRERAAGNVMPIQCAFRESSAAEPQRR